MPTLFKPVVVSLHSTLAFACVTVRSQAEGLILDYDMAWLTNRAMHISKAKNIRRVEAIKDRFHLLDDYDRY